MVPDVLQHRIRTIQTGFQPGGGAESTWSECRLGKLTIAPEAERSGPTDPGPSRAAPPERPCVCVVRRSET